MKTSTYLTVAAALATQLSVARADIALEEVIVTAQKKAESLQDTPISLTAFGAEQLEKNGIGGLSDIASSVPSMTIEPFPISNATLRIFIRGIGLIDAQITQDPPVGIYLDGAYIARSTGLTMDVADLARIEVLRGPQGTLYGRNSTGGTINLVSRRPDLEAFALEQQFTVGDRELFKSKTTVNAPLTDTAAVKLAYLTSQMDGHIENTGPGEDFGDRDISGYRVDLRWDITDRLRLDYSYDDADMDTVNYAYQAMTRPTVNSAPSTPAEGINAQLATNSQQFYDYSGERATSMATSQPLKASYTEISGHMLKLAYDINEDLSVSYLYAQRELEDGGYSDLVASGSDSYRIDNGDYRSKDGSLFVPGTLRVLSQEQSSHELQFNGLFMDSRIEYVGGLYYFEESATEDNAPLHHQFSGPISIIDNGTTTSTTTLTNFNSQFYEIENDAWAMYGRATYTPDFLDQRLHLTFGARHSEDSRMASQERATENRVETVTTLNANGQVVNITPPSAPLGASSWSAENTREYADDSFEFIAEWELNDDSNVYAKYTEAYKSGGFNTRDPDAARFAAGFAEEKVNSVELGLKSELLDRRLRLNADVFFSNYTDIQLNFLIDGTIADTQVVNAGEAEMSGFEMDLTFLASRQLLLMLNYAYLDAEITKATDPDSGEDITDEFVFSSAPQHSYTAALDYTVLERNWGRVGVNLSYNYMDDRAGSTRTESAKNVFMDDYKLINGRVGVYDIPLAGGQLTAALWGKNLADEDYVVSAVDNLPHADRAVIWGEPRSYGLDVIYRY